MLSRVMTYTVILLVLAMPASAGRTLADSSRIFRPYLTALVVKDAAQSAGWYCQTLGFQITKNMDFPQYDTLRIIFLRLDMSELELIEKRSSFPLSKVVPGYDDEKAPVRGFSKVAFMVNDVRGLADSLRHRGVRIRYGPFEDEPFGIRTVIVEDPDGNLLQFSEPLKR
jgi:catechol 2,3-dioxygenase-like lactoylglutathione lyase family enzyme